MTPPEIIELARTVLGTIELDPASSVYANQFVKAAKIYTQDVDALSLARWADFPTSIYLNPPGGKSGNKSVTGLFWDKLMEHLDAGLLSHAIFMSFSVEALQSTQLSSRRPMMDFPICVPRRRIRFVDPGDATKQQPSHSNAIVYVPGVVNRTSVFKEVFSAIGCVK